MLPKDHIDEAEGHRERTRNYKSLSIQGWIQVVVVLFTVSGLYYSLRGGLDLLAQKVGEHDIEIKELQRAREKDSDNQAVLLRSLNSKVDDLSNNLNRLVGRYGIGPDVK